MINQHFILYLQISLHSSARVSFNPEASLPPYPQECLAVCIPPVTHTDTHTNVIEMPLSSHTSQTSGCTHHHVDSSTGQGNAFVTSLLLFCFVQFQFFFFVFLQTFGEQLQLRESHAFLLSYMKNTHTCSPFSLIFE